MGDGYFGTNFGRPTPGTDTREAASYDDILREDGDAPWQLLERGQHVPHPSPIDVARYHDPRYVELEIEHLWKRHWQMACREEDIPEVGDRIRYDIANLSFMVVRTGPDTFKAFYNRCLHRGRSLCDHKDSGATIRCPFHAWSWNLDGSMAWLPSEQDFPHVDKAKYALPEVQVARWGGHVFINPDPDAASFESSLGVLDSHFADHRLDQRYTAVFVRKRFEANWKVVQEVFLEAYHMVETHWDALPFSGDTATLYDCWDEGPIHIDRLTTPLGVASGWFDGVVAPDVAVQQFLTGNAFAAELPPGRGTAPGDARRYAAECKRAAMKEGLGIEPADTSPAYLLDACRYFLYPNFHPWWGEGVPIWYRFLPDGLNPASSVMEIRVLLPLPTDGSRPAAAEPIELGAADPCAGVAALGFLGHIIDQDTQNIAELQKGLQTAAPGRAFLTLAREQESSIAHFHEFYAKALKLEA